MQQPAAKGTHRKLFEKSFNNIVVNLHMFYIPNDFSFSFRLLVVFFCSFVHLHLQKSYSYFCCRVFFFSSIDCCVSVWRSLATLCICHSRTFYSKTWCVYFFFIVCLAWFWLLQHAYKCMLFNENSYVFFVFLIFISFDACFHFRQYFLFILLNYKNPRCFGPIQYIFIAQKFFCTMTENA